MRCRIHPSKRQFRTRAEAEQRLAEIRAAPRDPDEILPVAAYRCPCGSEPGHTEHWLLTHRPQTPPHIVAMLKIAKTGGLA